MPAITLRYFPVRGRAEPLRGALRAAGVAFHDLRVRPQDWPSHKLERDFAGPFDALPTLTWGSVMVAETLPIASFLFSKLGHDKRLDAGRIALLDGVCSAAYTDIFLPMGELIWSDVLVPGVDPQDALRGRLPLLLAKLAALDRVIGGEAAGYFGGKSPTIADFFLYEVLDVVRYVLNNEEREALVARLPGLHAHREALAHHPAMGPGTNRPQAYTGRPDEGEAVGALRALDLSAAIAGSAGR